MKKLKQVIATTLSLRLTLMVGLSTAVLLMASLLLVLHFSRKAIRKEAMQKAEQSLEGTMQHIDNILLSVEQTAGNVYWNMVGHMDNPERMFTYARQLVVTNPYISGAAIALEPDYYKERGKYFMAYVHQSKGHGLSASDSPVIQAETFGNRPYNEQEWYTVPMQSGYPMWIGPMHGEASTDGAFVSFCLPLYNAAGQRTGVLGVDVELSQLSQVILDAKPSPNAYCILLGKDGTYIVHPDSSKLQDQTVEEAAETMVSGKTGHKEFTQNGTDWHVFYKPFQRADVPGRTQESLGWNVAIVYPEDDIFGEYNSLLYDVLAIALAGLVLLLTLCLAFTRRRLLPLHMLSKSAQRIAGGNYDERVADSSQDDEIGLLQNNFQRMQQSLAVHVSELERLRLSLETRGEELRTVYHKAKEADRMKTAFLNNMTNQMIAPSEAIVASVDRLSAHWHDMSHDEADRLTCDIRDNSQAITDLLDNLLNGSDENVGKEEAYG